MAVTVNWSQVLKRCRPEVHKKILETRSRHEELRRLIAETKASMPAIDFAKYKAALPVSAHSFVQEQEKLMTGFQIKKIDVNSSLHSLEAERASKMREAVAFLEDLELDIAKLKHKLAMLKEAKPADEMTPDDVYEMRPELKQQFDEALSNDNWSTSDGKETDSATKDNHHESHY